MLPTRRPGAETPRTIPFPSILPAASSASSLTFHQHTFTGNHKIVPKLSCKTGLCPAHSSIGHNMLSSIRPFWDLRTPSKDGMVPPSCVYLSNVDSSFHLVSTTPSWCQRFGSAPGCQVLQSMSSQATMQLLICPFLLLRLCFPVCHCKWPDFRLAFFSSHTCTCAVET